jgi:hypothetical protein
VAVGRAEPNREVGWSPGAVAGLSTEALRNAAYTTIGLPGKVVGGLRSTE